LLLECDCRRETRDAVDLGDAHLIEEAAGVGSNGFEIPALRFGIEGPECERGLAGAGYAGEDDQRVSRDLDVDVFQVVLAGSPN